MIDPSYKIIRKSTVLSVFKDDIKNNEKEKVID